MTIKSAPYGRPGSKFRLARWITRRAGWIPHQKWGELFAGTCSVTLQKEPVKWEFLNDRNLWISNVLSVLRDRDQSAKLLRLLRFSAWEDHDCERCAAAIKKPFSSVRDPVEPAREFLVANQQSFNKLGLYHSICDRHTAIQKWKHIGDHVIAMADRIRDCHIFDRDYTEVLTLPQVNDPTTLIYADPPYVTVEKDFYDVNRAEGFDHAAFRKSLDACQASIMVSYAVCRKVRDLYSAADGWEIEKKKVKRCLGNQGKTVTELLLIRMSDWAAENALKPPRRMRVRDIFADELARRSEEGITDEGCDQDAA